MYNFLFPFLFSSSSPVISLSLLVFLHLLASSFAAAAKASPSSSSASLSLFFSHTPLQPNKLATMPPARRDQNANINASTSESTATIQVPSTMTPEQTDLIFELTRRKLEAEMAAAEVEARLRRELMVKESEARVAASVAAASAATTAAAPARRPMADEEDDITGEVPTEVMSITLRFAGLPQEEIVRIFQNKFKPINLYRLPQIRGLQFYLLHDQDRIGIEDGMLKLRKTSRTYKDFGKSFYLTSSTTTPPSLSPSSAGRSQTSISPSPSSTPISTSSPKCTSGKKKPYSWPSRLTLLLLPSNP